MSPRYSEYPHSWELEDHEPEDLTSPEQQAADDAGVPLYGEL